MNKKRLKNEGMTLPELILSVLMLSAFTAVFAVVTQFTARFFQPLNPSSSDISDSSEVDLSDILNDQIQINEAFDSIVSFLSEPGIDRNYILNLKCTSLPKLEWDIPGISNDAIPNTYKICIKPSQLSESSYLDLNNSIGKPGIYIIYAKPNNGISYNATPIRRIFCRPKPFCTL
ncbi:hypothetical protein [Prochlorococcus marinus]|uniref:hypothetical protein n=1 Tax=Prochlorococcus marinus TaxID=1219 RepID=UPI001ADB0CAE|nr:hypothetical protein [Prochlorococcus marinus]MBO8204251.1 hypothetical protein [Prochlorococcus marinus CUG1415]MBW3043552.1 hypothetical protein [Prochlorococcus marinus str. MU1415]